MFIVHGGPTAIATEREGVSLKVVTSDTVPLSRRERDIVSQARVVRRRAGWAGFPLALDSRGQMPQLGVWPSSQILYPDGRRDRGQFTTFSFAAILTTFGSFEDGWFSWYLDEGFGTGYVPDAPQARSVRDMEDRLRVITADAVSCVGETKRGLVDTATYSVASMQDVRWLVIGTATRTALADPVQVGVAVSLKSDAGETGGTTSVHSIDVGVLEASDVVL